MLAAGIILTAVGCQQVLTHTRLADDPGMRLTVLGGPALYLIGNGLFIRAVSGQIARLHFAGIVVLMVLALLPGLTLSPMQQGGAAAVILIGVAVIDPVLYRRRMQRATLVGETAR